jgi:hypothetical protein
MEAKKNAYKILVRKSEGKRPLGRPGRRWEDIKSYLTKVGQRMRTGFIWLRIGTGGRVL